MVNISCGICWESIQRTDTIFTTQCGHIYHHHCLLDRLEESETCPECREACNETNIHQLYLNLSDSSNEIQQNPEIDERLQTANAKIAELTGFIISPDSSSDLKNRLVTTIMKNEELKCKLQRANVNVDNVVQKRSTQEHKIDMLRRFRSFSEDNIGLGPHGRGCRCGYNRGMFAFSE